MSGVKLMLTFLEMNVYLAKLAQLPRKAKITIMVFADLLLLSFALWTALALKEGSLTPEVSEFSWLFVVLPLISVFLFVGLGLYRAVTRYMKIEVVKTVALGLTLSTVLLAAIVNLANLKSFSIASILIYWVFSICYIASWRYLAKRMLRSVDGKTKPKEKVAIYGAGEAGLQTATALMSGPEFSPVLFFDDNPALHDTVIAGIPVCNPEFAFDIMDKYDCNQLLLAIPSATRSRRREIIQKFEGHNIQMKTVPGMGEIVNGTVLVKDIREVGIEDLLGRDPVPPFQDLISTCITGKAVLVTGAGGSIGSEICRQVLLNKPKKLVLFERTEFALYSIEQEIKRHFSDTQTDIVCVLGDVLDENYFENILNQNRIETVYHAAAYKHVPLVEENIIASVMNNIFGTLRVAQAARKQKVSTFVLISTDKAVRPTNVMGATKRMAEIVLQAMAADKPETRFCMVRFGNVLGSSGSVVPLFKEQIRYGGPVTVTHPEVTRFFMTVPEASQLVIQAGSMGVGGDVFVLDMGESIKIFDLAKKMIELSGLQLFDKASGSGDISVEFTGLRPGEKLYEELLIGNNVGKTAHPRIMRAEEDFIKWDQLKEYLTQMHQFCLNNDSGSVFKLLQVVVKEFQPAKTQVVVGAEKVN